MANGIGFPGPFRLTKPTPKKIGIIPIRNLTPLSRESAAGRKWGPRVLRKSKNKQWGF